MPEYLAPGVYVEDVSFGSRPIEGVPTDIAAFLGPTAQGPGAPTRVASFAEFSRTFGDRDVPGGFLVAAVRAFFANGGRRAWIAKVGPDNGLPDPADYEGQGTDETGSGLAALAAIDDISLVAAPDAPAEVKAMLVRHCETRRDRLAVLDGPPAPWSAASIEAEIAGHGLRSSFAAYYVPWIVVADGQRTAHVPPSGAVCGIIVRSELERGLWKAPANEVVFGALGLDKAIDTRLQDQLNPRGINAIRVFEGHGIRLWGARTLSDDPEWRYVNVRRLMMFLEVSIERGLQWAVFEPNDEPLWARARASVENFLTRVWRDGALQGTKTEQAFFVKCDRTTMTQNDLDNGRLILVIGVAPVKPAEFVIVRIGLWTASA
jgi:phage tail sheath protein FI